MATDASMPHRYNTAYLWMICVVAAMGGLLFGYDWVVVGGAKAFYEPLFEITDATPLRRSWAQSSALRKTTLFFSRFTSLPPYSRCRLYNRPMREKH